jgi:hypothetical protein
MEQAVLAAKVSQIPWYAYTGMTLAPFIVGCIMAIAITTYWKRMNKKSGGEPYPVSRQYKIAFLGGFACGCFAQYGLQEMGEFLLRIPALTLKATVVTGVFVAIFNPMIYDILRGYTKRKGWHGVHSFLTVQHHKIEEPTGDDTTLFMGDEDITGPNDNG